MLTLHAPFIVVYLNIFAFALGNSESILLRVDNSTVSFSVDLFGQFYKCACEKYPTCSAVFYTNSNIYQIDFGVSLPTMNIKYYQCRKHLQTIVCEGDQPPIPSGSFKQELNCQHAAITFVWEHDNDGFSSNGNALCEDYCANDCSCLVTTTLSSSSPSSRETTTTATTTATTTTATITTPTTSTTEISSTLPSPAANSTNTAFEDNPPLGLVIGVVIAVIVITIIIVVIGLFIWRRKLKQSTSKRQKGTGRSSGTDLRSLPQNGSSDLNSSSPYALPSSSSNYSFAEEGSDNKHQYAKISDENFVKEAKLKKDKVTPIESAIKPAGTGYELATVVDQNNGSVGNNRASKQVNSGDRADYGYCAISDTVDTKKDSRKLAKNEVGIKLLASQNGEYGYSTVRDQDIQGGGTQPCYEFAGEPESQNKDSGYKYAGPEYTYDTPHDNKSAQINKDNSHKTVPGINGAYSVAGNVNNSAVASSDKSKDIYSKLHEDNRNIQNPYNTLLQSNNDDHNSQTTTASSADQTKDIYNRLHEDNIQQQNPYNTLSQPTDDPTSPKTSLAGLSYASQTASQPSRYSFAQLTSNGVSSKKTDDNTTDNNKATTSQNNTYHDLEPSTKEGPQEQKEKRDNVIKKRNNYFELEKQEDAFDYESEEV